MSYMTLRLTISTDTGQLVNLEVDPQESVDNLKALVEVETGILHKDQVMLYNGVELQNSKTVNEYGVKSDDLIVVANREELQRRESTTSQSGRQIAQRTPTAEEVLAYYRSNPQALQHLLQSNAPLAETIVNEDIGKLRQILAEQERRRREAELREMQRIAQLNSDPFNPENQRLIEEEIRMRNVEENMAAALEHNPEAFGSVVMLYIDCEVNNTPVKCFVDSGAQMTIMSEACAKRCGIMRLVDHRWSGYAKGVGTARIIGRVHVAHIKIGRSFFTSSFTILEGSGMDFLLGLDMLKRHQCIIDLKNNCLRIGDEAVPFLAEKDIPKADRDIETMDIDGNTLSLPRPAAASTGPPATASGDKTPSSTSQSIGANVPKETNRTTPASPPQRTPPARAGNTPFPEEHIQQLMGLGYSRELVLRALAMAGGNVDLAAGILFEQSGAGGFF